MPSKEMALVGLNKDISFEIGSDLVDNITCITGKNILEKYDYTKLIRKYKEGSLIKED